MIKSTNSHQQASCRNTNLFPDEVRDVRGHFRGGAVRRCDWNLKHVWRTFSHVLVSQKQAALKVRLCCVTWLAGSEDDDEGPPFSHRNADDVEAPPCKDRSKSYN